MGDDRAKRKVKDNIINMMNSNRLEEAKFLIDEYFTKIPDDWEIYSIKANMNFMEKKFNEAEKVLREGMKLAPNNLDIMYNIAYLYENTPLKCLPLALNYYKRCLEIVKDESLKDKINTSINNIENAILKITDENKKPLVSIVVLAYNHLKYTKLCIESIYKYTSHIKFELITVNNGSSDGTETYFNSLPNDKKIRIVNNVGPVDGFNVGIECAEGKYTAAIGNDFILTENWLDNLITCIESDEFIGMVSPGANIVSNFQSIECKYKSIDEMHEFAKNYNESNPKKWEERIRLLPCVLMCKTNFLKSIHGYDPRFYFGEFADDDISIRIRRAGYKLIYAGDTFVHHGGSITTGKEHVEKRSLDVSKKVFIDKYKMDNHIEITFNPQIIRMIDYKLEEKTIDDVTDTVNIFGINTYCGGTTLQIKNKLKSIGVEKIKIVSFTEEQKYIEDLKTISDEIYYSPIEKVEDYIIGKSFDFIIYEGGADYAENIDTIISTLRKHLKKDGKFIFAINNKAYYGNLFYADDYEQTLYNRGNKVSYLNLHKVVEALSRNNFNNIKIDRFIPYYREDIVNNLIASFSGNEREQVKANIVTTKFIISCNV